MAPLHRAGLALLALCLVWNAWPHAAQAQETPLEGTLPDSIVVTAARVPVEARQTGRRVTVWTAEEIAALPVASFDELLRTVGGVEAQSRGGFGVQTDLTMRGSSFNGVLVLVDGVRLNDPMTGHFLADLPIPLSEIARVEVLRGPAAALYGPDALGGVVQILTYTGLTDAQAAKRLGGSLAARAGGFGLYDLDAAARANTGRLLVSGATAWQGADGEPILDGEGQHVRQPGGVDVTTDFERRAHTLALSAPVASARLFARVATDDRDFGAYHFYTAFASDTAREATATRWAQLRLQGGAQTRWQVQVAGKEHRDRYVYNMGTPANRHTSRLGQLQAQATRALGPRVAATAGLAAHVRSIDSNNLGTHDDAAGGAFGHLRWQSAPRLTVNGGARLEADVAYGAELLPQLDLAYVHARWGLRAGAGRAVRAPNYIERYFNTTLARPRGRSLGNPDLKAERAWAFEAGADLFPASGVALHATAFYRATDDLIDYVRLSPADTVWLARNLLEVTTRGLELDAALTPELGAHRLRLSATYTWLEADLGAVPPGVEYKYALTHARHLVQGAASVTRGPVQLGLQALWKDRLVGASYGVVHARAGYVARAGRQRVVLHAEVRNLFDTTYAEVFDAPMPGRWWIGGVRLVR